MMPDARKVLTPSQLNALARSLLEDTFALVEVEGELSNLSRPASGHLYCTLKDARAQIRCALFRPKSQWLKFAPVDGMQVLGRGRLSLYEPRGDYQLILEHLAPAGEGLLQRAFEELKAKLQAEGLFDQARKKTLPAWCTRIAVISSPSGAAIHDVLAVLRRRFPLIEVDLLPVPVQGKEAVPAILSMLDRADRSGCYDALLLTRGGGSLEDLACFNDEALARRIAACTTPTVAAIGHEVDFTMAELVADLRAPTPSAAAEALSRDQGQIRVHLGQQAARLQRVHARQLTQLAQRVDGLSLRLHAQRPDQWIQRQRTRLQQLRHALQRQQLNDIRSRSLGLQSLQARLQGRSPQLQIARLRARVVELQTRSRARTALLLRERTRSLQAMAGTLDALSPLRTLARGFAVLRREGELIRSADQVARGEFVTAQLAEGVLKLRVEESRAE